MINSVFREYSESIPPCLEKNVGGQYQINSIGGDTVDTTFHGNGMCIDTSMECINEQDPLTVPKKFRENPTNRTIQTYSTGSIITLDDSYQELFPSLSWDDKDAFVLTRPFKTMSKSPVDSNDASNFVDKMKLVKLGDSDVQIYAYCDNSKQHSSIRLGSMENAHTIGISHVPDELLLKHFCPPVFLALTV